MTPELALPQFYTELDVFHPWIFYHSDVIKPMSFPDFHLSTWALQDQRAVSAQTH